MYASKIFEYKSMFKGEKGSVYYIMNRDELWGIETSKQVQKAFSKQEFFSFVESCSKAELLDFILRGYHLSGPSYLYAAWETAKKRNVCLEWLGKTYNVKDLELYVRFGVGALVFSLKSQRFLILKYNVNHLYWGLVKGGMVENESLKDTLWREMYEETGLVPKVVIPERFYTMHWYLGVDYVFKKVDWNKLMKKYITWMPVIVENEKVRLSNEHLDYKWVDLDEAKDLLTNPSDYELLKAAYDSLKEYSDK